MLGITMGYLFVSPLKQVIIVVRQIPGCTVGHGQKVNANRWRGQTMHFFSMCPEGSASICVVKRVFDLLWLCSQRWCVTIPPIKWQEGAQALKTKHE